MIFDTASTTEKTRLWVCTTCGHLWSLVPWSQPRRDANGNALCARCAS